MPKKTKDHDDTQGDEPWYDIFHSAHESGLPDLKIIKKVKSRCIYWAAVSWNKRRIKNPKIAAYIMYTQSFRFFTMASYFCLHSSEHRVSEMGMAFPHMLQCMCCGILSVMEIAVVLWFFFKYFLLGQ